MPAKAGVIKAAKKAAKKAARKAVGPKRMGGGKKSNMGSRASKAPMGPGRTRTRGGGIAFASRYVRGTTGNRVSRTVLKNDTAISTPITGAVSTATSTDMVWMFSLNPGLPPVAITAGTANYNSGLSNWQSQQAKLYQKHRLRKNDHITIRYKHLCAVTQAGLVGISVFKDPKLAIPVAGATAQTQYIDQKPNRYGAVHEDFTLTITGHDFEEKDDKLIRIGAPTVTEGSFDLSEYDYGYVVIWLSNVPAGVPVGVVDVNFSWEVNTPSVLLANVSESGPDDALSDHYVLDSSSNTVVTVNVPLNTSTSRFNWALPLGNYVTAFSSTIQGGGQWGKFSGSNLGSAIDSTGLISFPSTGIFIISTRLQLNCQSLAVGDVGVVPQWTVGSTLTNYTPITRAVTTGCTLLNEFASAFGLVGSVGMGISFLNTTTIANSLCVTDVVLVTNKTTGTYTISGWSANWASFAAIPAANQTVTNTIEGDVFIAELAPAQTVRILEELKRKEEKEMAERNAKIDMLLSSVGIPAAASAGFIYPKHLSDQKEIKAFAEDVKILSAEGRALTDSKKGGVSPTPSLQQSLDRVMKEDYVVLSRDLKDSKDSDGQKRARSLPRAVQK